MNLHRDVPTSLTPSDGNRCNHKPEFKAKLAMTVIQGELAMAEMIKEFGVHANRITEWKKQSLDGVADLFGSSISKTEESEVTIQELHAKIGQLTKRK